MYFPNATIGWRIEYLHTLTLYIFKARPRPEYNLEVRPTLRFPQNTQTRPKVLRLNPRDSHSVPISVCRGRYLLFP